MQPPFDLNLMMTSKGRDLRERIAKAESARQLKLTKSKSNALTLGGHLFRSIGISLKNRAERTCLSIPKQNSAPSQVS